MGFELASFGGQFMEGAEIPVIGIVFAVIGGAIFIVGVIFGVVLLAAVLVELLVVVLLVLLVNLWAWLRRHPKYAVVAFGEQVWIRKLGPGESAEQDQLQLNAGSTPRQCGYRVANP